jgi:NAD(P)-dependent dehydrogenase (short-subunit alcohol dehydrogenase family)
MEAGQVAIVAGVGRGIEAAGALAVAEARVLAVDLHKERTDETVATHQRSRRQRDGLCCVPPVRRCAGDDRAGRRGCLRARGRQSIPVHAHAHLGV